VFANGVSVRPLARSRPGRNVVNTVAAQFNLTERDLAILDTLSNRVRVVTATQLARTWFGDSARAIDRVSLRMRGLEERGLVEHFDVHARGEVMAAEALVTWEPGDVAANFDAVSYQLVKRWTRPATLARLWIATEMGAAVVGGIRGRRPRLSEVSHDISLTGLYLRQLQKDSVTAKTWLSEAHLRRAGFGDHARLPDAMVERDGKATVIEFGGAYSGQKLREFHTFCSEEMLPYELW
jgi:hypothetical protein